MMRDRALLLELLQRPLGVLPHQRLCAVARLREPLDVVGASGVPQYDGGVALESRQLRALHGRAAECLDEVVVRHGEEVPGQRWCITA